MSTTLKKPKYFPLSYSPQRHALNILLLRATVHYNGIKLGEEIVLILIRY